MKKIWRNIKNRVGKIFTKSNSFIKNIFGGLYKNIVLLSKKIIEYFYIIALGLYYNLLKYCLYTEIYIKKVYFLSKKYSKYWLTILFFILAFCVAYFFNPLCIKESQSFFFSVGGMVGGMIAILFSFYIFLIQNISDKLGAGYFHLLGRDKVNESIFRVIILITIGFFVMGANFDRLSSIVSFISIFLIFCVFWLFFFSFVRVYNRVNPHKIIDIIVSDIKRNIKKIDSTINKTVHIQFIKIKSQGKEVDKKLLFESLFPLMSYNYGYINTRIEFLFDFYEKLRDKKDYEVSLGILRQIYQIIDYYYQVRSNNIGIDYSVDSFLYIQSDANKFLYPIFEKFISKIEKLILEKDLKGIRDSIGIYKNILIRSCNLKYDSQLDSQYLLDKNNPIFNSGKHYLFTLSEVATKENNVEALYQLTLTYRELSFLIIKNEYKHELESFYKEYNKIILHGYLHQIAILWQGGIDNYLFVLRTIIDSNNYFQNNQFCLEHFFEGIQSLLSVFVSSPVIKDVLSYFYFKGFNMDMSILDFKSLFEYLDSNVHNQDTVELLLDVFEKHRKLIRYLSDSGVDFVTVNSTQLAESFYYITVYLFKIQLRYPSLSVDINKQISWYTGQLTFFIKNDIKFEDNNFLDEVVHILLLVGIKGIEIDNQDLIDDSIEYIFKFLSYYNKNCKRMYDFSEPRVLLNVCYIGIFLIKAGKTALFDDLKAKLLVFDDDHKVRWKLTDSALFTELIHFYEEKKNPPYHSFLRKHEILLAQIQTNDVKLFIEQVFDIQLLDD